MKKMIFLGVLGIWVGYSVHAQVVSGSRPMVVKPVTQVEVGNFKMSTLQDTLMMLMAKVQELEAQRLPGGKKTVKVVTPSAANMCFPYKNPKFPSQTFYQGVVVDDALCNGNPNAVLIVTARTAVPMQNFPVSVSYDAADGKWKISLQSYQVNDLAKNVRCYNFEGKDPTMCPSSGLYHDVGIMGATTLSPNYDNKISFNVLITEKSDYKLPKMVKKAG
jgi:hypothetical protein